MLNALYERGILRVRGTAPSPEQTVMLLKGEDESMVRIRDFLPLDGIDEVVRREADRALEDRQKAEAVRELVSPFVRGNIVFDSDETERRRQEAREAVTEHAGRDFKKDEVILQRGERITQEHVTIARSMEHQAQRAPSARVRPHALLPVAWQSS